MKILVVLATMVAVAACGSSSPTSVSPHMDITTRTQGPYAVTAPNKPGTPTFDVSLVVTGPATWEAIGCQGNSPYVAWLTDTHGIPLPTSQASSSGVDCMIARINQIAAGSTGTFTATLTTPPPGAYEIHGFFRSGSPAEQPSCPPNAMCVRSPAEVENLPVVTVTVS